MRDPERIKEIMPLVQSCWEKSPDLRLGQLLCALASFANVDVFNMEDDQLLLAIQKFHTGPDEDQKALEKTIKEALKKAKGKIDFSSDVMNMILRK
jgi:uncharacterized protein YihD (DUF1040 family)